MSTEAGDRKVKRAHKEWKAAIDKRDIFMGQYQEIFEEFEEILDEVNRKRDRLERVCREEGVGVGPITVSRRTKTTYDGRFLYDMFEDDPDAQDELVQIEYRVKTPVFQRFVQEGRIKRGAVSKAVLDEKITYSLSGVPPKAQIL